MEVTASRITEKGVVQIGPSHRIGVNARGTAGTASVPEVPLKADGASIRAVDVVTGAGGIRPRVDNIVLYHGCTAVQVPGVNDWRTIMVRATGVGVIDGVVCHRDICRRSTRHVQPDTGKGCVVDNVIPGSQGGSAVRNVQAVSATIMQQIVVNADVVKVFHPQVIKRLDNISTTQMVDVVVSDLDVCCTGIE